MPQGGNNNKSNNRNKKKKIAAKNYIATATKYKENMRCYLLMRLQADCKN